MGNQDDGAAFGPGSREPRPAVAALRASIPSAGFDWYRLLPRFWLQNEPTDRDWDGLLSVALDVFGVSSVGSFSCRVGPLDVWIRNWPYAYGTPANGSEMPTVATRLKLRNALREYRFGPKLECLASAIEARSAETVGLGPKDESAVPLAADAQPSPEPHP